MSWHNPCGFCCERECAPSRAGSWEHSCPCSCRCAVKTHEHCTRLHSLCGLCGHPAPHNHHCFVITMRPPLCNQLQHADTPSKFGTKYTIHEREFFRMVVSTLAGVGQGAVGGVCTWYAFRASMWPTVNPQPGMQQLGRHASSSCPSPHCNPCVPTDGHPASDMPSHASLSPPMSLLLVNRWRP